MEEYFAHNLITVIVPVYNTQKYLDTCVRSIIDQTYQNLEIILIDDGSTDESGRICDSFVNLDARIRVVHKTNEGLVAARKTGIEMAKGDYITFVDSDDYIDKDTYEVIVRKMAGSMPDMVLFELVEVYPDHRERKHNHFRKDFYVKDEIRKEILPHMLSYGKFFDFGVLPNLVCKLIKRDFVSDIKLEVDKSITIGEDAAHTYQLMAFASDILIIDFAPYHYCKRNDSMMWKKMDYGAILHLEADLRAAFKRANVINIMEQQLRDYINFVTLLKQPSRILCKELPWRNHDLRVALYGAGGMGQAIYFGMKDRNVTLWVDIDYERYHKMELDVRAPEELLIFQDTYDVIFIAILKVEVCQKIEDELINRGIKKRIYYISNKKSKTAGKNLEIDYRE